MKVSRPIEVSLPADGVLFAESIHSTGFHMAERADAFHKVVYVLAGRVTFRKGKSPASSAGGAGTLFVIPGGTRHQIADVEPSTLLLLCLTEAFLATDAELRQLWRELARASARPLLISRPQRLRLEGLWRRAMLERSHPRAGGGIAVRSLAAQLLVLLARLPARETGDQTTERVAAVAREIDDTFYDDWDLDRAAARAGVSRRRFSELFRTQHGATFWEFLNRRRLDHAARLLRAGEHSVVGVMFSCGFNDLSHFYRLFRRRFGLAPKAWAASNPNRFNHG
jgi:AraC-like DNA-binding protein/mannose-6-phosphate isomerase-like protein (cupin superfamily)